MNDSHSSNVEDYMSESSLDSNNRETVDSDLPSDCMSSSEENSRSRSRSLSETNIIPIGLSPSTDDEKQMEMSEDEEK